MFGMFARESTHLSGGFSAFAGQSESSKTTAEHRAGMGVDRDIETSQQVVFAQAASAEKTVEDPPPARRGTAGRRASPRLGLHARGGDKAARRATLMSVPSPKRGRTWLGPIHSAHGRAEQLRKEFGLRRIQKSNGGWLLQLFGRRRNHAASPQRRRYVEHELIASQLFLAL
jgi:hypothetical protein